jgi:hypothetical protein
LINTELEGSLFVDTARELSEELCQLGGVSGEDPSSILRELQISIRRGLDHLNDFHILARVDSLACPWAWKQREGEEREGESGRQTDRQRQREKSE